jgi:hypothetical protein
MARVYLETSFISACVSTRADISSQYRRQASTEWLQQQSPRHDVFVSAEVLGELEAADYQSKAEAVQRARQFPLLVINELVLGFSAVLVRERVMPGPVAKGDSLHVAVACLHSMDYLLTWNVRHLANRNKIEHLQIVCARMGFLPPRIVTPDFLWENE